jgi:hypothetical protein
MTINELYNQKCHTASEINRHLPVLFKYGQKCNHITEFGVSNGQSTTAFLAAKPNKFVSYDIKIDSSVQLLVDLSIQENINFYYILHSSNTAEIENTDLLFIDSEHSEENTLKELANTLNKINKYIIFHDSLWANPPGPCVRTAIDLFLKENKNWKIIEELNDSYGLLVMGNTNNI